MLRTIYLVLLRLHPRFFRQQFAEEMLWIFDQTVTPARAGALLRDAFRSLVTQWMLRSEFESDAQLAAVGARGLERVPVFYVAGSEIPPPDALVKGLFLAVCVFALASFALSHSGTNRRVFTYYGTDFHAGPELPSDNPRAGSPSFWSRSNSPGQRVAPSAQSAGRPGVDATNEFDPSLWTRITSLFTKTPDPKPPEAGMASAIAPSSAIRVPGTSIEVTGGRPGVSDPQHAQPGMSIVTPSTSRIHAPGDSIEVTGNLSVMTPEERALLYFRARPVLSALDSDHDGILSRQEIASAPAVLIALDRNEDGKLDADECGLPVIKFLDTPPSAKGSKQPNLNSAVDRSANRYEKALRRFRYNFMRTEPVLAALDANHDGFVSMSEVSNSPAALKALDRDHDGRLTLEELAAEPVAREVATIFQLDTDFDGRISQLERMNSTGRRMQALFQAADRDKDGFVTWEELAAEVRIRTDRNHDGVVDMKEMSDARESGALYGFPLHAFHPRKP